jgi:GNAT superfamily N-acetyltransferase
VRPADADLAALSRALLADPEREGVQLLGLLGDRPVGFATVFWTWETTSGGRIGVMNDLFVAPDARGHHVGTALIEACADLVREHGGRHLAWVTAPDNARAQRVYDRLPTRKEHWLTYVLDLHPWTGATE